MMTLKEYKSTKERKNFFLTDEARRIIEVKVRELGISKSGVVELSLRELDKKNSLN